MSEKLFYLASIIKTEQRDPYICFWRPENAGYAWPLSWAGKYTEARVRSQLSYYHNGDRTIAVHVSVVDALAVPPEKGTVDGDSGPVVPNTSANWGHLLMGMMEPAAGKSVPKYPRETKARRAKG